MCDPLDHEDDMQEFIQNDVSNSHNNNLREPCIEIELAKESNICDEDEGGRFQEDQEHPSSGEGVQNFLNSIYTDIDQIFQDGNDNVWNKNNKHFCEKNFPILEKIKALNQTLSCKAECIQVRNIALSLTMPH